LSDFKGDQVDAINQLLARIGVTSDLGHFLGEHLTEVLRRQYADVTIQSIGFVRAHNCSGGGMQTSDSSVIAFDKLCIPVDISVVLVSKGETYRLDLHFRIIADSLDDRMNISSDVIVLNQSRIGSE
jgi:hypothetical protein